MAWNAHVKSITASSLGGDATKLKCIVLFDEAGTMWGEDGEHFEPGELKQLCGELQKKKNPSNTDKICVHGRNHMFLRNLMDTDNMVVYKECGAFVGNKIFAFAEVEKDGKAEVCTKVLAKLKDYLAQNGYN